MDLELDGNVDGDVNEPLSGTRSGQRSIRLNETYRAFYRIEKDVVEFVDVFDVNPHEY